ncbi:retrotransposon protein [Cucumis melo var. makuwa]|uniref:Retrotransposon protein n=1 Tax=Cucumis melo var. makuwa TaxID=1194695 RepID=A0A5D3CV17_CUCMM|nr:retrotransposon protein [Cucumis melo var. makuwa]TYK15355.1 retrotransposon protein [Cucumis melo var. makuwa]
MNGKVHMLVGFELGSTTIKACDVITGFYYLCDVRYPNAEGFLALYIGQRYHLQEWCEAKNPSSTAKEFFNMKHSSAWNV